MSRISQTRRCQKKNDTKESARVIKYVYFFCHTINNKLRIKTNGLKQTVPWVNKSPKTSLYVREKINLRRSPSLCSDIFSTR